MVNRTPCVDVWNQKKLRMFGWIVTSKDNRLQVLMRMEGGVVECRNVCTVDFGLENFGGISIKTEDKVETFTKMRDENGVSYMKIISV